MNIRVAFLAILCAILASCSSSSSSPATGGSDAGAGGGDAGTSTPANTVTVASDSYTLQPGDEKYYCYTTTLTEDTVITGFNPTYGSATHHMLLAYTIAAEPDGFFECPVLIKTTWIPMFVGGKGTSPLALPAGSGMSLKKGQQILLQLHLQDATLDPVTETAKIDMTTQDPSKPFEPAGIYGLFNQKISIPAGAANFPEDMTCQSDKTMTVFAGFAHMHKHGTHITLTNTATNAKVYDADWKFDIQPTVPLSLTVNPGDNFKLECQYNNTGTDPITYGESSDNEMCGFIFYYTKFDALDGCVQN